MKKFLSTFKEELISIPLILIGFFLLNAILGAAFPHSAFFDFYSQIDTLGFRIVSFTVTIALAWFGFRVMTPKAYKYFINEFYHKFDELDQETKRRYAVRIFLVLLLTAALVTRSVGSERSDTREQLLQALNSQLNVREKGGPNKGPEIAKYLHSVGVNKPAPWCAAFVSFNLQAFQVPNPNSAWSPDYAKPKDIIWTKRKHQATLQTGDVVTYYNPNLGRVGHVGFFERQDKAGYFITIEGNTNGGGSRDGDGVYKKKRPPEQVYAISRFIK